MAVTLSVKGMLPFIEIPITIENIKEKLFLGVRVYRSSELIALKQEYSNVLRNDALTQVNAKLNELETTGDKTSNDYYVELSKLDKELRNAVLTQDTAILNFYKKQILFVKNAKITLSVDGVDTEVAVADSRIAQPIESLWADAEECLVVLLDLYFDFPGLGDSLIKDIGDVIFQNNKYQGAKIKNS